MGAPSSRKRARGGSTSGDYRWKKRKKQARDAAVHVSGDAVEVAVEEPRPRREREPKRSILERERRARSNRKKKHDAERQEVERRLRSEPGKFLWEQYVEWAGTKLSNAEKKAEKWEESQIHCVEADDKKLIEHVKEIVGADYVAQGNWKRKEKATPGVACIVVAMSGLRAAKLAPLVYDGRPVGKLFGKHIKVEVQREWLKGCCKQGLAPSAAGTAARIQRLVEEERLSMGHTSCVILDFVRDVRERNILDFESTKSELFDFLHECCRERIVSGKMKILLLVGGNTKADETQEELAADE